MSLRDAFKVNAEAANEGVWIDYPINSDGTVPRFKIARSTKVNTRYMKTLEKLTRPVRRDIELKTLSPEKAEKVMLDVFVDSVVLGWEHVQLKDDGEELPFTRDNAIKLFSDPEWSDLYEDLNDKSKTAAEFREARREDEAGN